MERSFRTKLQHAWYAFSKDPFEANRDWDLGRSYSTRPDRVKVRSTTERSMVISLYNRIAIDVASNPIKHVRVNEDGQYLKDIDSGLNRALNISANIDQTGEALIQDAVISMFDEGVVAIVPIETSVSPTIGSFDIHSLRVGKIVQWYPNHIRVSLYDERVGEQKEITVEKRNTAIIENPFFSVINDANSTLKRLIRKLALLDTIDEATGSGKLDIIVQLPYTIRTESKKQQAENRRKALEEQLAGSKYGIAYIDGTERVTQLNRPAENNLLKQIEYLTSTLYSQLGLSEAVFNGTADENTMNLYYNRTVERILSVFTSEFKRKFLTRTALSQKASVMYFTDPFRLIAVENLAEVADKFTRNEILSANEIRSIIGYVPSSDPRANELSNKNLTAAHDQPVAEEEEPTPEDNKSQEKESQNGSKKL